MSWWQWLLASLGMYFGAGLICAVIAAYEEGVKHSNHDEEMVDRLALDLEGVMVVWVLWPIQFLLEWIPLGFEWIYKRGKSRHARKMARQGRRAQEKAFKQLCKENGWNYKKVKNNEHLRDITTPVG